MRVDRVALVTPPVIFLPGPIERFVVGARVRVNKSFPYGGFGREGTIIFVPHKKGRQRKNNWTKGEDWLRVQFDDNDEHAAEWHRNYFDPIETPRS